MPYGMKIKLKIILTFSLISISLIALFAYYVSYFTRDSLQTKFFHRLEENARIVGENIISKDTFNTRVYYEVKRKYLRQLSEGNDYLLRIDKDQQELLVEPSLPVPGRFYQQAIEEGKATWLEGKTSYVGVYFEDVQHPKNLLVISEGVDGYGHEEQKDLDRTLLTGGLIALFFVIGLAFYFAEHLLKPLKILNDEVEKVSIATLGHRLKNKYSSKGDEIDQLYSNFNAMLYRLDISVQVQKSFIGNASHSLRTPLTIISGEAELALAQLDGTQEAFYSLENIAKNTTQMQAIINNLLIISNLGNQQKINDIVPVRLDELLYEIIKSETGVTQLQPIKFDLNKIPVDSDDLLVRANPGLYHIAFSNILSNAIKYGKNKPITVSLEFDGKYLIVKVSDEGIGIPKVDKSHIFNSFFRASNVGDIYGNGLGLVLARNILDLHDAHISLESEEEVGTTVIVRIPKSPF